MMDEYNDLVLKNEILESIFDNTHFGVVLLDREFNFIQVNKAYADTSGRSSDFFIGKNHFDLFPHEENEKIFRDVVQTGNPFSIYAKPFEYPGEPERGTTYWDWTLTPLKKANGYISRLLLVLIDVTVAAKSKLELEQYKNELEVQVEERAQQLKESEKRYQGLYENTPMMLLTLDNQGKIVAVSNYWLELLGYGREEVIGKQLTDFMTEDSKIYADYAVLPDFFDKGFCKEVEFTYVKKSGESICVVLSANAETDNSGQITRFVAVLQDITKQIEVESYRENLIQKLKEAVTEINSLRKILPICSYCKNIRNENGNFELMETYIHKHSDIDFSHTICPTCLKEHHPEDYAMLLREDESTN